MTCILYAHRWLLSHLLAMIVAAFVDPTPQIAAAQVRDSAVVVRPFASVGALGADPQFGRAVIDALDRALNAEAPRHLLRWEDMIVALPPSVQSQVQPVHLLSCLGALQMAAAVSRNAVVVCGGLEQLPDGRYQMMGQFNNSVMEPRILQTAEDGAQHLLGLIKNHDR